MILNSTFAGLEVRANEGQFKRCQESVYLENRTLKLFSLLK